MSDGYTTILASADWATLISGFGGAALGSAVTIFFGFRRENRISRIARFEKSYQLATVAGLICKEALGLKSQFLGEAIGDYLKQRELVLTAFGVPTVQKQIRAKLDLVKFGANDHLSATLIGELGAAVSRDFSCLAYTSATILNASNIQTLLETRNEWIDEFRAEATASEYDRMARYFGYPMTDGSIDFLFYNTNISLLESNDQLIKSSYLLYRSLIRHAMRDRIQIPSSFRLSYPVSLIDFSDYANQKLFPKMDEQVSERNGRSVKKLPFESIEQHIEYQINSLLPLY